MNEALNICMAFICAAPFAIGIWWWMHMTALGHFISFLKGEDNE